MKKGIIISISVILTIILGFVAFIYIWGGKPEIENFDDISQDYEIIANIARDYYKNSSNKDEHITIFIAQDHLSVLDSTTNNRTEIHLDEQQKSALQTVNKKFDAGFLTVTKNAVFFNRDETRYYGLVYSKNPLTALYESELPQAGREYHRINSRWYEWGVWGI